MSRPASFVSRTLFHSLSFWSTAITGYGCSRALVTCSYHSVHLQAQIPPAEVQVLGRFKLNADWRSSKALPCRVPLNLLESSGGQILRLWFLHKMFCRSLQRESRRAALWPASGNVSGPARFVFFKDRRIDTIHTMQRYSFLLNTHTQIKGRLDETTKENTIQI